MKKEKHPWGAIALICGLVAPVLFALMGFGTQPLFWADIVIGLFAGVMAFRQKTQMALAAIGMLICSVPMLFVLALITGVYKYNFH